MKQFNNKFVLAIIGMTIFASCQNSDTIENTSTDLTKNKVENKEISQVDIDKIIDDYVKSLSTSKTIFVDSIECEKTEQNIKDYEKDILKYQYTSLTHNGSENGKIVGDLNGDNNSDYIANYSCENCWAGIGAGNYLSNCFFITTQNNKLIVDEQMTINFKQKLIEVITRDFGNKYYKIAQKEQMINGLTFTKIENQTAYGTFMINTETCEIAQPCFEGTFEYNATKNELKMSGKNTDKE